MGGYVYVVFQNYELITVFHTILFIFFDQEDGDISTIQLAWESLIMAHLVFSRFV